MTIDFKAAKAAAKSKIASAINSKSAPSIADDPTWMKALKLTSDVLVMGAITGVVGIAASKLTDVLVDQAKKDNKFFYL